MPYILYHTTHGPIAYYEAAAHTVAPRDNELIIPCESGANVNDAQRWREAAAIMLDKGWLAPTEELSRSVLLGSFTDRIQAHLDAFALTKAYDSMLTVCSYATSSDPVRAADGQYCVTARDLTWSKANRIMNAVLSGTRTLPEWGELKAELPELTWPETCPDPAEYWRDMAKAAAASHSTPPATSSVVGHVKPGTGLSVDTTGALAVKYGAAADAACQGNDARLNNARTPTAHKVSHKTGGADAITPADIGAVDKTYVDNADTALRNTANGHIGATANVHGASSFILANTLVTRDAQGRARFASPEYYTDAANKDYVDNYAVKKTGDTMTGALRVGGEVQSTVAHSYRHVHGNYGTFWNNDGSNLYLLLTNSGNQYGTCNSYRPFYVNLAGGTANISGNAATATRWQTKRSVSLTGAVTGTAQIDGSANVTINTQPTGIARQIGVGNKTAATGSFYYKFAEVNLTTAYDRPFISFLVRKSYSFLKMGILNIQVETGATAGVMATASVQFVSKASTAAANASGTIYFYAGYYTAKKNPAVGELWLHTTGSYQAVLLTVLDSGNNDRFDSSAYTLYNWPQASTWESGFNSNAGVAF